MNALIAVLLVCACLLPGHAAFAAATRRTHRSASHKTNASSSSARKQARKKKISAGKTSTVHRRGKSSSASVKRVAAGSIRRKATSEDFVRASKATPKHPHPASRARQIAEERSEDRPDDSIAKTPQATAASESAADSGSEELATPVILPTIYNRRGRLIVPPPLKGSHEILVRQNVVADRDGLDRVQDDADLLRMRRQHLLVGLPVSRALEVDDRLPVDRRYCRPWTAQFLATLARAHYARFHKPLQVNSAVRTVEFQQHLIHINGNAAPAEGETASPHLTGQAIDIAKHGLSLTEIAWLRGYLLPLIQQGRIDVEEEFQQACFHISVYKKYMPSHGAPRRSIAGTHHNGTSALAAAIE